MWLPSLLTVRLSVTACFTVLALALLHCTHAFAAETAEAAGVTDADAEYVAAFLERYPKVEVRPALADYAAVARYDDRLLGESFEEAIAAPSNDQGGLAWGLAAHMESLNIMYEATGDAKYLEAQLRAIRAVLPVRDDRIGRKLWTGTVAAAWGCDKYAKRGRAVFAVHTGLITDVMFRFLLLAREDEAFQAKLGDEAAVIERDAEEALAVHDRQWRDGPGEGEGHYIGLDQEEVCENKPLPGNRLSAMGMAHWSAWKLTGREPHRDRAIAICTYIRNRLTPAPDGAYYWPYWLPEEPVTEPAPPESLKGEDSSHGGLTALFPIRMGLEGQVMTEEDMRRLAATFVNGVARRNDGILMPRITGASDLKPGYVGSAARWLSLDAYNPEVSKRVLDFYLGHVPSPGGRDLALIMRFVRKQRE